ncbi:MAG TPA: ABC transporter substrate-binding protein, partial [Actinomycetota bacterium]|nr:ABC transporter substrate-binding protein [Actinomycetota bacterium]
PPRRRTGSPPASVSLLMRAVLIVLALVAASCIPDPGADSRERLRTPGPDVRRGGSAVIAFGEPDGIDPTAAWEPSGRLVADAVCDTLVDSDPATGELRPAIAQSWTISGRGRRLTLKLRRGVRFHNGRELTADDVVYTLSRLADDQFASRSAPLMEPVVGYAQTHGETDDERFESRLVGLRATETYGVEISLDRPLADFVRVLTHPATAPVPREEVERDAAAFAQRPVCTGPYVVEADWAPGTSVRLRRFDRYYGRNEAYTAGGRGYLDSIELRPFPDAAAEAAAIGSVDVATSPAPGRGPSPGVQVALGRSPRLEMIGLPVDRPPFDSRDFRHALSMAVERGSLSAMTNGLRRPARGYLSAVNGGTHNGCGQVAPHAADPAAAKSALDSSGADTAVPIKLHFNDELGNRAAMESVAQMWTNNLGLQVQLEAMPYEQFLETGRRPPGFEGAFRFGWAPEVPSADAMLFPLFHPDRIGRDNLSRFSSRVFSRSLDDARESVQTDDRRRAYVGAEQVVCSDMPAIPLWFDETQLLVKDRLGAAAGQFTDVAWGQVQPRELFVRGG